MAFEYAGVDLPIREKTIASQRMSWEMIANPGRWWTGTERVEIARIGRAARDFEAVGSEILPDAAVYAIQKLVVDNVNLNREWYEEVIASDGITEDRYVELVAVVVHALSIDEFHRALGLELERLPDPVGGEPTCQRPAQAEQRYDQHQHPAAEAGHEQQKAEPERLHGQTHGQQSMRIGPVLTDPADRKAPAHAHA